MLRVTEQNEPGAWRLTLEGTLAGRWAAEAERVWAGAPAGKPREVDLRGVTSVDRAGRDLLHRMHHDGASFVAEGVVMKALVEELRSERFDRAGTIVRLVGVVALIGLASIAAAHAQAIGSTALSIERGPWCAAAAVRHAPPDTSTAMSTGMVLRGEQARACK